MQDRQGNGQKKCKCQLGERAFGVKSSNPFRPLTTVLNTPKLTVLP